MIFTENYNISTKEISSNVDAKSSKIAAIFYNQLIWNLSR
jgi:hypothetical protein